LSIRNRTRVFYAPAHGGQAGGLGVCALRHYNECVPTRLHLAARTRHAFERMAVDLQRVFGDRFVALVASGAHSAVGFATTIAPGDLEALGPLVETWHRDDLETPLVLTPHEFRRSLDAFPVEYQALLDRHDVIAGEPPFAQLVIDRANLRRACEVQAKSHLIHLRQGWVENVGHDERLPALIVRSAPALRALLSDVARLMVDAEDADPLAGAGVAGLDLDLVRGILTLEDDPAHARQLTRRLPDYLAQSERLWTFVDTWTS
jgi:hypothetical protein